MDLRKIRHYETIAEEIRVYYDNKRPGNIKSNDIRNHIVVLQNYLRFLYKIDLYNESDYNGP